MTNEHPQPGPAWTPEPDPNQHPSAEPQDVHPSAEPQDPHAAGYQHPYAPAHGYAQPAYQPGAYPPGGYEADAYAGAYQAEAYQTPGYGYGYPPPAAPPARRSGRVKRTLVGVGAAALAAGLVASGVVIGHETTSDNTASSSTSGGSSSGSSGSSGSTGTFPGLGTGSSDGSGSSGSSGSSSTGSSSVTATSKQQAGIVTIVSVLKYQNSESAGTGMVLTSNGEILTNNHVIDGATSITVTVETTGKSYTAKVVGTDSTDDIAVLQLENASGLTKANVGDSSDVKAVSTGDTVTGVGNGGGTGTLTSATGKVTALNKTITASDESGASSETLEDLIETDAAIISGDSGGPLYDSNGKIIGIDTAASSSSSTTTNGASVASQSYAIPITNALTIAKQIESGVETSSVHIGLPAFLGVGLSTTSTSGGVSVGSVVSGGPAAKAGITAGSTITAIAGKSVTSSTALSSALENYNPGDKVSVTWTDTAGASHTATVTLTTGPAD